jgi:glycosyltransferase involved in cell wall biosynthesis
MLNNLEKLRVMQLLSPLTIAGAERVVLMLLRNIDRRLFDVSVCLFINTHRRDNPFVEEIAKMDVPTEFIYLDKIFRWSYVSKLRKLLKKNEVDILHSHGYRADITGYLANRRWKAKLISSAHGWTSGSAKVLLYEYMDKKVLKRFDRVLAVSDDIKRTLIRHHVNADRIVTLRNAIDFDSYSKAPDGLSFRKELGIRNGDKLIGTVGRLSKEKGLDDFLRVAKQIVGSRNDVKFVIVGDGPEKESLIKLRDDLGLGDQVTFHGYVRDVSRVYATLDLFLLTSSSEGVPISLLEAAYFGKPCIATAVGGIPEILNGVEKLVRPGDVEAMAEQALYLLSHESEAGEYSKQVQDHLMNQCDPKQWIHSIQDIYRHLTLES